MNPHYMYVNTNICFKNSPTTSGSKSTRTARGTNLPKSVSSKNDSKVPS